jgi:hypothetical protein
LLVLSLSLAAALPCSFLLQLALVLVRRPADYLPVMEKAAQDVVSWSSGFFCAGARFANSVSFDSLLCLLSLILLSEQALLFSSCVLLFHCPSGRELGGGRSQSADCARPSHGQLACISSCLLLFAAD